MKMHSEKYLMKINWLNERKYRIWDYLIRIKK